MKSLTAVMGISFTASILLYLLMRGLDLSSEGAVGLASLPLIASHHIYEMLERIGTRSEGASSKARNIHSFQGFAISWQPMVVYGTIMIVGVSQLAPLPGSFMTGLILGDDAQGVNPLIIIAGAIPVLVVGVYFVGRWIGARCAQYGIGVVALSVLLGVLASKLLDYLLLSRAEFQAIYAGRLDVGVMAFGIVEYTIVGLIGYWRGRRSRLARYMQYLLGILPKDTRDLLVDLAHEEAKELASGHGTTRSPRQPGSRVSISPA